jgi:hypothetical protein
MTGPIGGQPYIFEAGYSAVTKKLTCSSYPLTFGKQADIESNYFSGLIDEVRIYDRALSAGEIQQLYGSHSGPIAHWKFDEGSGTTAFDSAGNNHGTLIKGPQWTTGQINGALSFDGVDDYVDCGSDQSLDVTELTWSLWIKRAEITYSNERALISNEGGGANTRGTYALQIDVGSQRQDKIQFVRHGDSTWPLSNTAIQDTDWHYIAVTRNSNGVVVIYIDGIPDYTGTIGTRTAFTKTVIGTGHTSYSNFYGLIDEVAIYNRALSAEAVLTLYKEGITTVGLNIKPGSCPNPLNVKSRGVLPMAILGSEDFDVHSIDIASIRLAGVAPIRSGYEDVATPLSDANECECSTEGPDGFLDLTLKFETQKIVEAIGEVDDGDELMLELTGVLSDETLIEGSDCVIIRGKHKPINKADFNGDGTVDMADFAAFAENWLQSSIVEY